MNELIPVTQLNEVDVVDSRIIADELGVEHRALIQTIRKHQSSIEQHFERVAFEMLPFETAGGAQNSVVAYLTEDQAIFVGSLSRNTETVVAFKAKLVKSFQAARKALVQKPDLSILSKLDILQMAIESETERVRLEAENKKLAPKAEVVDLILTAKNCYTVTDIAKELGMGAPTLNKKLCEMRIQREFQGHYILYAKYQDKGYTQTVTKLIQPKGQEPFTALQMVWTQRGRLFIHSKFNSELSFYNPSIQITA